MPRESIGQCGCAQYPDRRWITAELELAICYIRHACGEPPPGYVLEILWQQHDLGEYATVGITWDGPCEAPWDYISRAEDALERFDQAVSWSDLAPDLREPENDDIEIASLFNRHPLQQRVSRRQHLSSRIASGACPPRQASSCL